MKIEYIDNHQTRILMAKLSPNKNYFTNMDHATAATDVHNNDTFLDCMILKFYKLDIEPCKSRANRNCTNNARCLKGLGQATWLINQVEDIQEEDKNLAGEEQFCFRGLKNLGATCYINTFLQLWFHNVDLRQAIYKWRPNAISNLIPTSSLSEQFLVNPITCLQLVLSMMQYSVRSVVDPTPFIKCLNLDASQEQDTHEFLSLFNSYIQNKLNHENDKSIQKTINQQYCMKIAYIIKCSKCKFVSERESDFYELLLRVKGFKDIDECIGDYLKEENLDGTNRYACQICNGLQDAKRFIELRKLPPVLNLQLLRFESSNGHSRKISSFLKFPKRLDMSKFVRPEQTNPTNANVYNLFAVLIHEGQTAYSGHYITFIKKDNLWFKFNDENVEQLKDFNLKIDNDDDFHSGQNGGNNDGTGNGRNEKGFHKSKNAYMLVYKLDTESNRPLLNELRQSNLPDYLVDYIEKDNQKYLQEKEDLLIQKCQERLKELNHQRLVRQIFSKMELIQPQTKQCDITVSSNMNNNQNHSQLNETFDAIDKSWLMNFFRASTSDEVPAIDNKSLLCMHGKLNVDSSYKCISTESADQIYSLYKSDIRLKLPEYFCKQCIQYRMYMSRLKQTIDDDQKLIRNLGKFKNCQDENLYFVGKESMKKWKNLRIDSIKRQYEVDFKPATNFNFNEDLLCQHGQLCSDSSKRTLIRHQAWLILRKHFPGSPEFDENASPCSDCLEIDRNRQIIRDKNYDIALIQRSSLINLYNGELFRYWPDLLAGHCYHMIATKFYMAWKKFVSHPNTTPSPDSLMQYESNIICTKHSLFIFPPFDDKYVGYDKIYLILDQNEWTALTEFYNFSIDVSFIRINDSENCDQYELKPGFCSYCHQTFVQEEKQKRFIYDKLPIYVKKIVTEEANTDEDFNNNNPIKKSKIIDSNHNQQHRNDFETVQKNNQQQSQTNQRKRTLRKRRMFNELEILSSSHDKLKDIKVKIMQHFNVATYDQVLWYNGKQLLSAQNNCTIGELEIEPHTTLLLKVDDMMDENVSPVECTNVGNNGPEVGFKGTQLHLF
nr:ubiquitin carboxyl-terminal hydrolase 48-like [Dermatophagoides farinae]